MDTSFWLTTWEQNKIGFHQQDINAYLKSYWQDLGVPHTCRVFVPLCGKSLDMLWLCAQGHSVLGVELSPLAVRDFFAEHGLTPEHSEEQDFYHWQAQALNILQGDFFKLSHDHLNGVGGVFDRAALVALPPELRSAYARQLMQILPATASMLLVVFDYEQSQMAGPPFAVSASEIHALYGDNYHITLVAEHDALAAYPQLQAQGLEQLQENVYVLSPRGLGLS